MKQIRPIFLLDPRKIFHFCLQEATLSAIVITFYMVLSDIFEDYIDRHSAPKWQKYLMIMVIMFVSSFVSITFIMFIFGYDCNGKKK